MKLLKYILLLLLFTNSFGAELPTDNDTDTDIKQIAVLPFINYTNYSNVINIVEPMIEKSMIEKFKSYYTAGELRPYLRKNRIRNSGEITSHQALMLKEALGINYLVMGSYDLFNQNNVKEVGLSLRVIEISTMRVIYANSIAASDMDYLKLFGFGRIKTLEELSQKVIDALLENLSIEQLNQLSQKSPGNFKIAIVDFDNFSRLQRAGNIVANHVMTYFYQQGHEVIEPGLTKNIMIGNKAFYRGEIELKSIEELNQQYDVDLIITGTIDEYKFPQGSEGQGTPEAEIEIRILDATIGNILYIDTKFRRGNDSEKSFQLGRYNSLGKLSQKMVKDILSKFLKDFSYAATN